MRQGYTATRYRMKINSKDVRHAFGDDNNNNIDRTIQIYSDQFIQIDGEPSEMK